MQVQPIDILIAHKAVNLSTELSNSDKRVAGVLLDHFNRKTGQCDPGQNSVADLIAMSRRTVIRSIQRLERLGFFRKVRHGGKYHRNQYEPVWETFRKTEAAWCTRRKNRRQAHLVSSMSPVGGRPSHIGGDTTVNQTCLENQSQKTLAHGTGRCAKLSAPPAASTEGSPRKANAQQSVFADQMSRTLGVPSAVAARNSAERRWNDDLLRRFGSGSSMYGRVVEAIDSSLISSTTDTELRQRGSGLAYLMSELAQREQALHLMNAAQVKDAADV